MMLGSLNGAILAPVHAARCLRILQVFCWLSYRSCIFQAGQVTGTKSNKVKSDGLACNTITTGFCVFPHKIKHVQ